MLHQTLISPFFSFHLPSSSPSNSPLPLPYSHSSRVEKETTMDLEMICSGSQLQEEEPYHIFGEEFVDEFLDLGGLTETEKELDDDDDKKKKETEEEEDNSVSSAVSFEPPPPVSELALPAHDDAELEWVSRLMDDSLLEFPPPCSATAVAVPVPPVDNKPAQEISSSAVVIRAKRSKRTRSPSGSWSNWGPADYSTSSSTTTTTTTTTASSSSSSTSYSSSSPLIFFTPILETSPAKKQKIPKKRGRKPKPRPPLAPSIPAAAGTEEAYYRHQPYPNSTAGMERRCSHCGVNKTPQWRAGPMGAKTLCNACGVRYKSGRLLPEYRPACSPTFVSHVHSNSHRKVLEMRRKKETIETPKEDDQSLYLVCSAPAVQSF